MRGFISCAVLLGAVGAHAQVTMFNADTPADNVTTRDAWLAAAGVVAPDHLEDFESYAIGTALHGVPLVGGAVITDTNASPIMSVQSSSSFFGGSVPFGQGLALREGRTYNITFATPVTYVGMFDIDQGGSDVRVFLSDSSFVDFLNLDTAGNSGLSGEFFGFVTTGLTITSIRFIADGGDNEMGLDNLQYGEAVPEPATMTLLALGGLAVLRKRRK